MPLRRTLRRPSLGAALLVVLALLVPARASAATATLSFGVAPSEKELSPSPATPGRVGPTVRLTFLVGLSEAATNVGTVEVSVGAAGDTATGGESCALGGVDYLQPGAQTVGIPVGATSFSVDVRMCRDTRFERDETVSLTLSDPIGVALPGGADSITQRGTIRNDDRSAQVTIYDSPSSPAGASAGAEQQKPVGFAITLGTPAPNDVTLQVWTEDVVGPDAATAGVDYIPIPESAPRTVTIRSGFFGATVFVNVLDDAEAEGNELLTLHAEGIVGGQLIDSVGTGVIQDDDCPPAPPGTNPIVATPKTTTFGTSGDDWICGTMGADRIKPGAGNDHVFALGGRDALVYDDATASVRVDLQAGTAMGASIGDDEVLGFETAIGSRFPDLLWGTAAADTLDGNGGGDVIEGRDGWDVGRGDNGADVFIGGLGNDSFDGGAGVDAVQFVTFTTPVMVRLDIGVATGGGIDNLYSIENAIGGSGPDLLIGAGTSHDGVCDLSTEASMNAFDGGPGNDILMGLCGRDSLYGGSGFDRIQFTSSVGSAPAGEWVNLSNEPVEDLRGTIPALTASSNGGNGDVDALNSIEDVWGSPFDDWIVGSSASNRLYGLDGDDRISGGANPQYLITGGFWPGDVIRGGPGDDPLLDGGPGPYDQVYGDAGVDGGVDGAKLSGDTPLQTTSIHDWCAQGPAATPYDPTPSSCDDDAAPMTQPR